MTQQPFYGPHNPHPLSQMRTELVWEGKYDEYGQRREVDIAGCAMPMQRIEGIDEPRREAAAAQQLTLFEQQNPRVDDFRNRLVWGDNKLVMASLLQEFKGKVDLIYIDPPFDVGADFSMSVAIGDGKEEIDKDQSTLEMVAYRDIWGRGTDSYLHMLHERLNVARELLTEKGSIWVHVGPQVTHTVKSLLDDIYGSNNFRGTVAWKRSAGAGSGKAISKKLAANYDSIHLYSKCSECVWNQPKVPYKPEYLERFKHQDDRGYYRIDNLNTYSQQTFERLKEEGRLVEPKSSGANYGYKRYIHELPGAIIDDLWIDLPYVNPMADERVDYVTQNPEALLERIIQTSSNKGDLVADFFCGSGTTGAVAERLGRKWIMADLGRFAIQTSRKRLIELQRTLHKDGKPYRAFDVYNLGRYERQWWQQERLQGADTEHRRVILEFFRAEVLTSAPSPLLHGRKAGAFCHVDGIDSMFTREEAKAVAQATAAVGGRECYCLAWEFEMDLHLLVNALATELGVKLKLIQIPREIMEKNRKAPPPFLEVAVLAVEAVYRSSASQTIPPSPPSKGGSNPKVPLSKGDLGGSLRAVDLKLTQFLPSLAEVPSKELEAIRERAIRSGFDFIDFWAIDFNWQPGKPFTHDWQDTAPAKTAASKPSAMPPTPIPLPVNTSPASKSSIPSAVIPPLQ
jgi:adenine-specific DNA-methyltransferase